MAIVFDGIVIFVLLMSVFISYKRGFIKTVVYILGYFISFFVAGFLGKWLSNFIFQNYLSKAISEKVAAVIKDNLATGGIDKALDSLSHLLPDWLTQTLLKGQTLPETAKNMLIQNNIEGAANNITLQVIQPIVIMILSLTLFFIIFFIIRWIFHYLLKVSGLINKIPVVGLINGLLGGVLGVLRAALYLIMIAIIVWVVIILTSDSLPYINTNIINETNLFLLFYKLNPFVSLM